MHIFYVKKRALIKTVIILIVVLVSVIYTRQLRAGTLSVLFNNESVMPIYSVSLLDKKVAFTFDVSWGNKYTEDILETLKRYDIKSTFFITGSWAEKYPAEVKKIFEEGHEIGNHSMNHTKMSNLSKKDMTSEIKGCQNNIKKLTGVDTNLFRAPYGDYNNTLVSLAKEMKYKVIQWDVDSLDWEGAGENAIYTRVIEKAGNGSIVLFHNTVSTTPGALQKIIEDMRKKGYHFTTVSDLLIKENYYIDNTGRQQPLE